MTDIPTCAQMIRDLRARGLSWRAIGVGARLHPPTVYRLMTDPAFDPRESTVIRVRRYWLKMCPALPAPIPASAMLVAELTQ